MAGDASRFNGKKGGRPKGSKSSSTLEKEKVMKEVGVRIMENAQRILDAQLSIGLGQQFLYKIEKEKILGPKGGVTYKSKRPELVTAENEIRSYLDGLVEEGEMYDENDPSATYYFITTKEPSNFAIDSMFNRALGKPKDSVDITSGGKPIVIPAEIVNKNKLK